jgi:hypothetical protein
VRNRTRGVPERSNCSRSCRRNRRRSVSAITRAGPINGCKSTVPAVAPASSKWNGASKWVPQCTLHSSWPTLTVAPSLFRSVQLKRNGVSPGQQASVSRIGIVISRIVMTFFRSGDEVRTGGNVFVCALFNDRCQLPYGLAAVLQADVKCGRGSGRKECADRVACPQLGAPRQRARRRCEPSRRAGRAAVSVSTRSPCGTLMGSNRCAGLYPIEVVWWPRYKTAWQSL